MQKLIARNVAVAEQDCHVDPLDNAMKDSPLVSCLEGEARYLPITSQITNLSVTASYNKKVKKLIVPYQSIYMTNSN